MGAITKYTINDDCCNSSSNTHTIDTDGGQDVFCIDTITPNITLLQPPSDKLDISYATLGPLDDISLNNLVLFIPSSISHSPHNNPFDASNIHI